MNKYVNSNAWYLSMLTVALVLVYLSTAYEPSQTDYYVKLAVAFVLQVAWIFNLVKWIHFVKGVDATPTDIVEVSPKKGGVNKTTQVKERPAAPAPLAPKKKAVKGKKEAKKTKGTPGDI